MRSTYLLVTLFFFISSILSGCEVIGDIFKAGVWVGILIVVAIIALILFIVRKSSK